MQFGDGAISRALFDDIKFTVPEGSHILEFGSGRGTQELLKHYKVTSIEHNEEWLNKIAGATYKHVPIVDGYYERETFINTLESETFDAILIDGPNENRSRILSMLPLLASQIDRGCTTIIFDDLDRKEERIVYEEVVRILSALLRLANIVTYASIHSGYYPPVVLLSKENGDLRNEEGCQGQWGILRFQKLTNIDRYINLKEVLEEKPEWFVTDQVLLSSVANYDQTLTQCWIDWMEGTNHYKEQTDPPSYLKDGWYMRSKEPINWQDYGFIFESLHKKNPTQ